MVGPELDLELMCSRYNLISISRWWDSVTILLIWTSQWWYFVFCFVYSSSGLKCLPSMQNNNSVDAKSLSDFSLSSSSTFTFYFSLFSVFLCVKNCIYFLAHTIILEMWFKKMLTVCCLPSDCAWRCFSACGHRSIFLPEPQPPEPFYPVGVIKNILFVQKSKNLEVI